MHSSLRTLFSLGATPIAFQQAGIVGGAGAAIGAVVASGVGPTELPQTVAAFHSLVGIAAMAGAAGEYLGNQGDLATGTLAAIYLATFIGGVTFTGSIVAFGKLSGMMSSAPLQLPGRDQINLAMLTTCIIGMAAFLSPDIASGLLSMDAESLRLTSLVMGAAVSTVLGYHLTASIGGAEMPLRDIRSPGHSDFDPRGAFSQSITTCISVLLLPHATRDEHCFDISNPAH